MIYHLIVRSRAIINIYFQSQLNVILETREKNFEKQKEKNRFKNFNTNFRQ